MYSVIKAFGFLSIYSNDYIADEYEEVVYEGSYGECLYYYYYGYQHDWTDYYEYLDISSWIYLCSFSHSFKSNNHDTIH